MKLNISKIRTYGTAYLLLAPSLIFLILFTYYPVLYSFWSSMFGRTSKGTGFVGIGNYIEMFSSPVFIEVLKNNLIYGLFSTIPAIVLGLAFAILLNSKIRGQGFYRFSLFYPTILPIATASMVWVFLFSQSIGLINKILSVLGFKSEIDWVNTSPYAMMVIIFVYIWKYAGYYMLLFLSGLQSIDESLYEEAYLEGASAWTKIRKITLPLLSPTTFFVVLVAIINSFQAVDQIYVMTKGGPHNSTNVILYYIYEHGFLYWNTGIANSASSVLFVLLLIITFLYYFGLQHFVNYER